MVGKQGRGLVGLAACLLLACGMLAAVASKHVRIDTGRQGHYLKHNDSVDDVVARLAPHVDKDASALYAVWQAVSSCSPMQRQWLRRRNTPPADRAFWRWQARYCNGFARATKTYYYSYGTMVEMRGRHPGWDFSPGHEATYAQALYAGLLRDAPAPDLRTASFMLTYKAYGRVPWTYGRDVVVGAKHPERLPDYQRMALRLVECDFMGGCERNGVAAFELCREEGNCRWGNSVDDIVRRRFAPDEVAIIETLHRRIADERRFYAQSHLAAWHPSPLPKRRYGYAESEDFERWQARWNARRIGKLSQRR